MSEDAKPATLATQKPTQNWFASWFDTPYYHILYKERNYREAQIFMDNLTHYLNLPEKAKVLDLACGKGRHAIYLNQLGFEVIGADLSENSIKEASEFASRYTNRNVTTSNISYLINYGVINKYDYGINEKELTGKDAIVQKFNQMIPTYF